MYVYVKFDSLVKVISNVTIDEDCGPVVEGKLISDSPRKDGSPNGDIVGSNQSSVDAISWFKSLPVEAVYLDCGSRDARWCPKSVKIQESKSDQSECLLTPKVSVRLRRNPHKKVHIDASALNAEEDRPFMPETARPLFSEHPGVVDFNPIIDELFERAEDLVRRWEHLSQSGLLYREVAQILHCYVFPAVSFQREDIPVLQECLRLIMVKQELVEKDIKDTEKNVEITEKYLSKQKEMILAIEGMMMQSYLQACDVQFIESFYMHIAKDLQKKNARLESIQLKLNRLKKTGEEPEELEKLKKDRDNIHETVQKLITIREAIRNHLYRPFIPKRKKRSKKVKLCEKDINLHAVFHQVHQQLVEHKDRLRKLCYRKLYTSAMREAIESTIKMISIENNPRGLGDLSEFSVYVGRSEMRQEQWQSMLAKVEEWMSTDSPLFRAHMEGCQLIKDLANGILSDVQTASMGLEDCQKGQGGDGDLELTVMASFGAASGAAASAGDQTDRTSSEMDPSYSRSPMVRVMCDQVKVHTWEMAENMVNFMDFLINPGNRHINRAWVCYGPHFWQEAGEAVERLYTHFHAPQARKVHRLIRTVALADIMDSNFFRDFFTNRLSRECSNSGTESSEEGAAGVVFKNVDTVSAVSLDLMRCSVSDLYARVNRDGARMNYEMLEMEALTGDLDLDSLTARHSVTSDDFPAASVDDVVVSTNALSADPTTMKHSTQSDLGRSDSSASDSGASIHSEDLFDVENPGQDQRSSQTETVRSSQTMASVLSLFEVIVEPYHELVRAVLEAKDVMEKLRAVWKSVDFLCQKGGEICHARGMDTLLPLSIFATTSFTEDLFVDYYIQLLILQDLKPSFAFHSMYDFSLTNAISSYMYLFQANFPAAAPASDESDS